MQLPEWLSRQFSFSFTQYFMYASRWYYEAYVSKYHLLGSLLPFCLDRDGKKHSADKSTGTGTCHVCIQIRMRCLDLDVSMAKSIVLTNPLVMYTPKLGCAAWIWTYVCVVQPQHLLLVFATFYLLNDDRSSNRSRSPVARQLLLLDNLVSQLFSFCY